LNIKGVCYDVGRVMGINMRPNFDISVVKNELSIIKNDLHCNAIRICGLDLGRLLAASNEALKNGLEVWLSPEMWDKPPSITSRYILEAAKMAQSLGGKVVLSLGSELTLLMRGILEGRNFAQRMKNPKNWEAVKSGRHNELLNEYLTRLAQSVRKVFSGKITYASLIWESVDWSRFDFVGVDHYMVKEIRDRYIELLRPHISSGKPVVITEFGFRTYKDDDSSGITGDDDIVNNRSLVLHTKPILRKFFRPVTVGNHERDEAMQARLLVDQLTELDRAGVEGTFVNTFVSPIYTYDDNPRFDLDMSSYSLVKSYATGIGRTYPAMPWEPKESFWALADYYSQ